MWGICSMGCWGYVPLVAGDMFQVAGDMFVLECQTELEIDNITIITIITSPIDQISLDKKVQGLDQKGLFQ